MRNKKKAAVILVGLALLVLPLITSFANTYLEDKTMQLYKGETGEYCIYLQNTGEEDVVQVIKIFEGEDYIKNSNEIDKEFDVPVGTVSDDLPVCMNVRLPRDSEKGEKYTISYGVTSPSSNDKEGVISIAPIQIREIFYLTERLDKKPVPIKNYVISALVIIAVLSMGFYYRRRRKKLKI